MEPLFTLTTLVVLPFWALMIIAPTWGGTRRVLGSPLVAVTPALVYLLVWTLNAAAVIAAVGNPTIDSVASLLATPEGAALGWAHFLAFDLLVGRWAYLDSRDRAIHPLVMAPVLFAVFMAGPIGFLAYLAIRPFASRDRTIDLAPGTAPTPSPAAGGPA